MNNPLRILCLLAFSSAGLVAGAQTRTVAFLHVANLDTNPRYDYLAGMIKGLLLFDLSRIEGVAVVERSRLEEVLREQELQLSDLLSNDVQSVGVGKLLKADFLLKAE